MYFFNDTMQIYTIVIGSLFNNFKVQRIDNGQSPANITEIDVPLSYAGKMRWYYKTYKKFPDTYNLKTVLPLMTFQMTSMSLDNTRSTPKFENLKNMEIGKWITTAIPYKFDFTISIWTRYQTDMYQILEQILPFFPQGTRNVHVKEIPMFSMVRTCRIKLESVSPEVVVDFNADNEDRLIQTDIRLSLDGYLYQPITEDKLIQQVDVHLYTKIVGNNYNMEEIVITP